ncbi:hypothetical protein Q0P20_14180, partial [Staphylococcus aureus]|nr:hypothetical protein [Staphylococcus aureus]
AVARPGQTVLLRTGTYDITTPVTIPVGVRVQGEDGVTIRPSAAVVDVVNLSTRSTLANVAIESAGLATGYLLDTIDTEDATVRDVRLRDP